MEPGLYIVGTPIGNMADITFRAVETLRAADVILAEDTRRTRHILERHDIHTRMVSCHKFNEASRVEAVLREVQGGQVVAMVTDSGMPCVSDPGARVVRACREAGCLVTAVPGPSAVSTALALSGFGGTGYHFEGFLAHKSGKRLRALERLRDEEVPVVLFESPYRLQKLLGELEQVMGEREVFVAREMTKHFEETVAGTPADLGRHFSGRTIKGEIVVVVSPARV